MRRGAGRHGEWRWYVRKSSVSYVAGVLKITVKLKQLQMCVLHGYDY